MSSIIIFCSIYSSDYTLLLHSHYCCGMSLKAAQWFWRLAWHELVQWGTHPNMLRYCHLLYHTTFLGFLFFSLHFFPVRYLIRPPPAPVWHRQRPTHWFNPALFSNIFPNFLLCHVFNLSCTSASEFNVFPISSSLGDPLPRPSLLARPLPQLSSRISLSRPSGLVQAYQQFFFFFNYPPPLFSSTKPLLCLFPVITIAPSSSSQAGF